MPPTASCLEVRHVEGSNCKEKDRKKIKDRKKGLKDVKNPKEC